MKQILFSTSFGLLCILMICHPVNGTQDSTPQGTQKDTQKIYTIDISGDVEPGMAAFVERALRDIPKKRSNIIIFKMDTFGGRVDAALEIVDTITNTQKGSTIAYVSGKAISAGALIALASQTLYMKHGTTIGDCAPISYSNDGVKMMGEKFQSPLRAKFRALAKKNGYPELLAESMVTASMEVYRITTSEKTFYMDEVEYNDLPEKEKDTIISKKTVVAKDELLTMDDKEAETYGFSKMSVANIEELQKKLNLEASEVISIAETWSETFVRYITTIAPILMMIGLAAVYTEIKAPGFGAPGIIGIICLGLVFFNQYMVGLADYTELLIITIGVLLLGFEVFVIPGFGIAGISGLLCISAGMILALQDFVIPDPNLPWESELLFKNAGQVMGAFILAFILSLTMLRYVLPRISTVINGPYLNESLRESHADSSEISKVTAGTQGIAHTPLRPSGKMKIAGDTFDVITQGEFLEKGTPIVILEIKGNRIFVTKKQEGIDT